MKTATESPVIQQWEAGDYCPSKPQWEAAFRLARAYGHEWAEGWSNEGPFVGRSLAHVAKSTKERRAGQGFQVLAGIEAPSALGPGHGHPVGTLSHTTGSGRLIWDIRPSGKVELTIERPGGKPVISALVTPHPSLGLHAHKAVAIASDESSRGQYHARHVEALRKALVALVGPSKAKVALRQATAWALPDEAATAA